MNKKKKTFNDKLKEAMITKDKLLLGKLIWMHYDLNGNITLLDNLNDIKFDNDALPKL
jgi:hypothetical protein